MDEQSITVPRVSRVRRSVVAITAAISLAIGGAALTASAAGAAGNDAERSTSAEGSSGLSTLQTQGDPDEDGARPDCPEEDSGEESTATNA